MKCIATVGSGKAKRPCKKDAAKDQRHCTAHAKQAAAFKARVVSK